MSDTTMRAAVTCDAAKREPAPKPPAVDWAEARSRYPVANNAPFLNITSGTPPSNDTRAAVHRLVDAQRQGSVSLDERHRMLALARERFARVIGAQPAAAGGGNPS